MTFGKDILEGALQEVGTSEVRNPLLKVALIVIPFAVVFLEVAHRHIHGIGIRPEQEVIILYGVAIASIANTSESEIGKFLKAVFVYGLITLSIVSIMSGRSDLLRESAQILSRLYKETPILSVVNLQTWVTIFAIVTATRAARNIHSRDALWLGRVFLSRWAFQVYVVTIVAHAIVFSVLFTRLDQAWSIAKSRYYLTANRHSAYQSVPRRFMNAFRSFLSILGRDIEYVSDLIYSLVQERGFFREKYKDSHITHYGRGDLVAITFLTITAVIAGVTMLS